MLSHQHLHAFVPTLSFTNAKAFYCDILGLPVISENPYAMELNANGALLRVTLVQELTPHPFTVLGWGVASIDEEMQALIDKGVIFEQYGLPQQDDNGVWTAYDGTKVAWFKDPDGNLLSLAERKL